MADARSRPGLWDKEIGEIMRNGAVYIRVGPGDGAFSYLWQELVPSFYENDTSKCTRIMFQREKRWGETTPLLLEQPRFLCARVSGIYIHRRIIHSHAYRDLRPRQGIDSNWYKWAVDKCGVSWLGQSMPNDWLPSIGIDWNWWSIMIDCKCLVYARSDCLDYNCVRSWESVKDHEPSVFPTWSSTENSPRQLQHTIVFFPVVYLQIYLKSCLSLLQVKSLAIASFIFHHCDVGFIHHVNYNGGTENGKDSVGIQTVKCMT